MDRFRQSPSDLEEKFRREFREIDFPLFVSSRDTDRGEI